MGSNDDIVGNHASSISHESKVTCLRNFVIKLKSTNIVCIIKPHFAKKKFPCKVVKWKIIFWHKVYWEGNKTDQIWEFLRSHQDALKFILFSNHIQEKLFCCQINRSPTVILFPILVWQSILNKIIHTFHSIKSPKCSPPEFHSSTFVLKYSCTDSTIWSMMPYL